MAMGMITLNAVYFPLATMILTVFSILLVIVEPFKPYMAHCAILNMTSMLLLAMLYAGFTGVIVGDVKAASPYLIKFLYAFSAFIGTSPLLYISLLTILWMYRQKKFGVELFIWRQGYHTLES